MTMTFFYKMEDAPLKRITFALAIFLLALSFCSAQETKDSLNADLQNAKDKKALGIGLTIGGGVVLVGTYVYYVAEGLSLGVSADEGSNSQAEGKAITWLSVSAIGVAIGICGLAFGIPNIISGAIRQHKAQNKIDSLGMNTQTDIYITPHVAFSPSGNSLELGFTLSY
jgi:hypothetical protein